MKQMLIKTARRTRRIRRVRKRVAGTVARPRLAVARSVRAISAQIIDDLTGRTLCAASSRSAEIKAQLPYGGNVRAAAAVGKLLGEKAKQLGIEQVCFDCRGRKYHGRIKALAEAAREAGLKF